MTRLDPTTRHAELLSAGRILWASKPFDAVRPDDITAATGTSIGLVYHHFGSKRGFYVATVRDAADRLISATDGRGDDPASFVLDTLRGFVRFVADEGPLMRAVLRGGLGVDDEVASIAQRVRDLNARRVLDRLAREETPELTTRIAGWIGLCEAVALDHVERRVLTDDAVVGLLADALWRLL
ncbi:MAG: TetR/AcrR family transcriptional regulator [Myxococcota bacterium]